MTKKSWKARKAKRSKRAFPRKDLATRAIELEELLNRSTRLTVQEVRVLLGITQLRLEAVAHFVRRSEHNFLGPVDEFWLSRFTAFNFAHSMAGARRLEHEKIEKTRNMKKFFVYGLGQTMKDGEEPIGERMRAQTEEMDRQWDREISDGEKRIELIDLILSPKR